MSARSLPLALLACNALAFAFPAGGRAEEMVLMFEKSVRTVTQRPPGRGGASVDSTGFELVVLLGERRVTIHEQERTHIYDFATRRIIQANTEEETYGQFSLFGLVAFSDRELASRLKAAPGDGKPPPTSVLEAETLFSMAAAGAKPGPAETIADSSDGDRVHLTINGRTAAAAVASDTPLSAERAAMFERFLLYHCRLHPAARRAILRLGRVPGTMFYRFRDGNEETAVLLTLKQAATAPERSDPIRGLRRADVTDEAHVALSERLRHSHLRCNPQVLETWRGDTRKVEDEALAAGRYLDARLASAERALTLCEPPTWRSWPAAVMAKAEQDSAFDAYRDANRWKSRAEAHAAVPRLAALPRDGLVKSHLLDLASARAQMAAGDRRAGIAGLIHFLERNPCAAEVWMELGAAYLEGYETVLAWLCFDRARAIAPPGCEAVARVDELEKDLLARRPEFF